MALDWEFPLISHLKSFVIEFQVWSNLWWSLRRSNMSSFHHHGSLALICFISPVLRFCNKSHIWQWEGLWQLILGVNLTGLSTREVVKHYFWVSVRGSRALHLSHRTQSGRSSFSVGKHKAGAQAELSGRGKVNCVPSLSPRAGIRLFTCSQILELQDLWLWTLRFTLAFPAHPWILKLLASVCEGHHWLPWFWRF